MRRFQFRLALALGMTVREMLARMDSAEFAEWMAYARLEPFGPLQDDMRAGVTASTFANANRGKKSRVFKPDDFMASLKAERRRSQGPLRKRMAEAFEGLMEK